METGEHDPTVRQDLEIEQRELRDMLAAALHTLTRREEAIIGARFGLGDAPSETYAEIGQRLAVTTARIRQIESSALRKLRHPSRSRPLREFI